MRDIRGLKVFPEEALKAAGRSACFGVGGISLEDLNMRLGLRARSLGDALLRLGGWLGSGGGHGGLWMQELPHDQIDRQTGQTQNQSEDIHTTNNPTLRPTLNPNYKPKRLQRAHPTTWPRQK